MGREANPITLRFEPEETVAGGRNPDRARAVGGGCRTDQADGHGSPGPAARATRRVRRVPWVARRAPGPDWAGRVSSHTVPPNCMAIVYNGSAGGWQPGHHTLGDLIESCGGGLYLVEWACR